MFQTLKFQKWCSSQILLSQWPQYETQYQLETCNTEYYLHMLDATIYTRHVKDVIRPASGE